MFGIRTIFAAALVAALIIAPKGSLGEQATTTPPAQPNYRGAFSTEVLAGGTVNELKLPFPASRLPDLSTIKLQVTSWDKPSFRYACGIAPRTRSGEG